jgi:hypothetical protein
MAVGDTPSEVVKEHMLRATRRRFRSVYDLLTRAELVIAPPQVRCVSLCLSRGFCLDFQVN